MEELTMLDYILKVSPMINQFTQADLGVAVCDCEKWLLYIPAETLDLKAKVGDPVKEGAAAYIAMREKRRVVQEIDAGLYGVPYIAVGIPIFNEAGEVIGGMGVSENTQRRDNLVGIAKELEGALHNIQATMQEIAAEAQELSATSQEMKAVSDDADTQVKETAGILEAVRQIAKQTNLIGLNASIEAARAGEMGRGFNVVANEVRNLSGMTSQSTGEIEAIIGKIKEAIKTSVSAANVVSRISNGQAEKLQSINFLLDDLVKLTDKLLSSAEELTV